jgi:hypothetical protein
VLFVVDKYAEYGRMQFSFQIQLIITGEIMPLGKSSRTTSQGRRKNCTSPRYNQQRAYVKARRNKREKDFRESNGYSQDWLFALFFLVSIIITLICN